MKTNKNGVKLLAAIAVLAMVFASFAVISIGSDSEATNTTATVGGVTVNFNNDMTAVPEDNKLTFTGVAYQGDTTTKKDTDNSTTVFGTRAAGYEYAWLSGITGNKYIVQKNSALSVYTGDVDISNSTGVWTKSKAYSSLQAGDHLYFLIPKDGSSVVFDIYDGNSATGTPTTITLDFSKVSTKIVFGSTEFDGTNWTYTYASGTPSGTGTLALNNYNGQEIFTTVDGCNLIVTLTGTNTLTSYQNVANNSAISSAEALTIKATSSADASLTVDVKNPATMGIGCYGSASATQSVTIGDNGGSAKKTTVSITGTPDVGIFAYGGLNTYNSEITTIGSERAIRVGSSASGNALINNSTINATILDSGNTNGRGDDDIFGIKIAGNLSVDANSTITTEGLRVGAGSSSATTANISNNGKIIVSGDYTQNPAAKLAPNIAGFYYPINASSAATVYNAQPSESSYILLNGADVYGNVIVKNATGTEVQKKPTAVTSITDLSTKMADPTVDSIAFTGSGSIPSGLEITKTLTIVSGTVNLNNAVLTDNSSSIVNVGGTISGTVKNGNNTMTATSLTGSFAISYGSVSIDGQVTGGTISILNDVKISGSVDTGTVTITTTSDKMQKITMVDDMTIVSGSLIIGTADSTNGQVVFIVPENKTLRIESGATLQINGALVVYGTVINAGIINSGNSTKSDSEYAYGDNYSLVNTGTVTDMASMTKVNAYKFEGSTGVGNTITGDTEWKTATYLTSDLEIAEGVTVTIANGAYLDLCGYDLVVKGNLIVNTNAYIIDSRNSSGAGSIALADTGSIQNSGIIGKVVNSINKDVTITMYTDSRYTGYGAVTLKDVSGVVIDKKKTVSGTTVSYNLMIAGNVIKKATGAGITVTGTVYTSGDLAIPKDVTLTVTSSDNNLIISKNDVLTINGTVAGNITILKGAVVNANGISTATYTAATGEYNTYNNDGSINTTVPGTSTVALNGLKGISITVSSISYDNASGVNKTLQKMSISGTGVFTSASPVVSSQNVLTITGNVYVLDGEELVLGSEYMAVNGTGTRVSEGKITAYAAITNYKGTSYSIKAADGITPVYYYTDFDSAFEIIDTVETKTVTVKGGVNISSEIVVKNGQTITFSGTGFTVKSAGKVTIEDGAIVSSFNTINGMVVVKNGGSYTATNGSYQVRSANTAGDVTYSGAAVAIKNAVSGTTVYIVSSAEISDSVTVASGVTIDIADGATLTAKKGMTVAEGGKVVNKGTLTVDDKYNLDVAGEIDSKDGNISVGGTSKVNVTGTIVATSAVNNVNGVQYSADGYNNYTTVAKAIEAVSAMDVKPLITVKGAFSEASEVVLVSGMSISIPAGAELIIKSMTLSYGSNVIIAGTLTTDIIAKTGAADTTGAIVDANVSLTKASNVKFIASQIASTQTGVLTMLMVDTATDGADIEGKIVVESGNVTISGATVFNGTDGSLVIDGTVTVPESASITATQASGKKVVALTVNGTLDIVKGTVTVAAGSSSTVGIMDVSGTVNVSKTVSPAGLIVNGTMNLAGELIISNKTDSLGRVYVDSVSASFTYGKIILGEKPTTAGASGLISGPMTINGTAYVLAYPGSDLSAAKINWNEAESRNGTVSTAYNINGGTYMTVYALADAVQIKDILSSEKFELRGVVNGVSGASPTGLYDMTNWYNTAGFDIGTNFGTTGDTTKVGAEGYEAIYAHAETAEVLGTISTGVGLSIYIDGVSVNNFFKTVNNKTGYYLTVGQHKVMIENEYGYDKTNATITFNGVTVADGGSIVIEEEGFVLSATGATPAVIPTPEPTPTPTPSEKDDSMGITEYLLIVLVILAAILVVVVAIRMMRS